MTLHPLLTATITTIFWLLVLIKWILKTHNEHKRRKQLIQHLLHDLQAIANRSTTTCTCHELRDLINTLTEIAEEDRITP